MSCKCALKDLNTKYNKIDRKSMYQSTDNTTHISLTFKIIQFLNTIISIIMPFTIKKQLI